ncbi:hypothetical protein ACNKHW_21690 [Shigella flexneri]
MLSFTIQQHNQSDVWLADKSRPSTCRRSWRVFSKTRQMPRIPAASWQAGHTGSGLHYRRYPFLLPCVKRAGPVTWVIMIALVVVFIAMQILAIRKWCWLAWPFDPTLKFPVLALLHHALMHFSLMHILLTCSGGGISAARWKNTSG